MNKNDNPATIEREPEFLTVADVAKMMYLSERTAYSYLMKGIIPGRKVGHRWYVYRPALVAWLAGEAR